MLLGLFYWEGIMEVNSVLSSALSGLNNASQHITESSERIATQAAKGSYAHEEVPITTDLVNMKLAEIQAKASVKAITTADEMIGSLINTIV